MDIFLYAHTGSGNHGCEALVRATSKLLGCKPVLYSTGYEEDLRFELECIADVRRDEIAPVHRASLAYLPAATQTKLTRKTTLFTQFSRRTFLKNVNKGDLCLSIGGDNYCYAGTEVLADLNTLLRKKKAKTVLWGCSIDPEVITHQMVKDLKQYDLITVRESLTREALAQVGVTKNVRTVADPAFLLDIQETQLPRGFIPGNTIGLNLSPLVLAYTSRKENALSGFYALVQHVLDRTDSAVALIPHVIKDNGSDLEILAPIYERFKDTGRVLLLPDQNCMQLKYIISQCRLFIGARTHATIAAYSTEVPTLAIGYSIKSRGIATDLFGSDQQYVLPIQNIETGDDLVSAYDWLEEHASEMKQNLHETIPAYKEQAIMGKNYLCELMNKECL